ncbi:Ig-like domain-containing protein [bacterium]|nr:Ig-like domain-containing protein [bacterium]
MKKFHPDFYRILKRLITIGAAVFLLTAFMVGCQDSDNSKPDKDTTALTVSETFPADAATNITINSAITASFVETMNPVITSDVSNQLLSGMEQTAS